MRDVIQREDVQSEVLADGRVGYLKVRRLQLGLGRRISHPAERADRDRRRRSADPRPARRPGRLRRRGPEDRQRVRRRPPLYCEQTATGDPLAAAADAGRRGHRPVDPGRRARQRRHGQRERDRRRGAAGQRPRPSWSGRPPTARARSRSSRSCPARAATACRSQVADARPDLDPRRRPDARCRGGCRPPSRSRRATRCSTAASRSCSTLLAPVDATTHRPQLRHRRWRPRQLRDTSPPRTKGGDVQCQII